MPKTDITVKLIGKDGNAYAIIGEVVKAMRKKGMEEEATQYMEEAMKADYDHLLRTTMQWVNVE